MPLALIEPRQQYCAKRRELDREKKTGRAKKEGKFDLGSLHANHGGTEVKDDLHLPIGEGHIDFDAILRVLQVAGYDGMFCFKLQTKFIDQGRNAIQEIQNAQD